MKNLAFILLIFLLAGCSGGNDKLGTSGKAESRIIRENVARILKESGEDYADYKKKARKTSPTKKELLKRARNVAEQLADLAIQGKALELTHEHVTKDHAYVPERIAKKLHLISPYLKNDYKIIIKRGDLPSVEDFNKATHRIIYKSKKRELLGIRIRYEARYDLFIFKDYWEPS